MRRRTVIIVVVAVVVVLAAAAVPAYRVWQAARDRSAEKSAATAFATAWHAGTLARVTYAGGSSATVAAQAQKITASLTAATTDVPSTVTVGPVTKTSAADRVAAALTVTWNMGGTRWTYPTTLPLQKVAGHWRPVWSPAVVHPQLSGSQVLRMARVQADRGQILGSSDQVLVTERSVVDVGLEPDRTTDLAGSAQQIAALTGVDAGDLLKRAQAARKTAFVDVITLRSTDYAALKARLQPIPGAVFQARQQSLAPSSTFAKALLGTVGPVSADDVKASGGRLRAGDYAGINGVQHTYDAWLGGTAGLTVTAYDPIKGLTKATLFQVKPVAGKPLHLSLDLRTQQAAEAALATAPKPAGMVAIQASTGKILAVANGPSSAAGYDRALLGQYPPGSTFKIVTTYGLLGRGVTPSTTVNCPPSFVVSGKTFTNAESERFGAVPFSTDFAQSCNTAFVSTYNKISTEQLTTAAKALGYGRDPALGVTAFDGQPSTSDEPVAHAASMIGQGTVLASPLVVAGTSAAIAAGSYISPKLVLDPDAIAEAHATPDPTSSASSSATSSSATPSATQSATGTGESVTEKLDASRVAALRTLMRGVVTGGTGTALKSVPGGPVYGKTGTAEFGTQNPPQTHAWFTGFQGDVAFAVVVEDGGFGAQTAAPLMADFLTRLAAG